MMLVQLNWLGSKELNAWMDHAQTPQCCQDLHDKISTINPSLDWAQVDQKCGCAVH